MPLLGFTVFKDKLVSGEKCQTIRKPRKRPLKLGDVLHVYWMLRTKECEKLGVSKIIKIKRKTAWGFTQEDAVKDGFGMFQKVGIEPLTELLMFLDNHYRKFNGDMEFVVISFEPIKKES